MFAPKYLLFLLDSLCTRSDWDGQVGRAGFVFLQRMFAHDVCCRSKYSHCNRRTEFAMLSGVFCLCLPLDTVNIFFHFAHERGNEKVRGCNDSSGGATILPVSASSSFFSVVLDMQISCSSNSYCRISLPSVVCFGEMVTLHDSRHENPARTLVDGKFCSRTEKLSKMKSNVRSIQQQQSFLKMRNRMTLNRPVADFFDLFFNGTNGSRKFWVKILRFSASLISYFAGCQTDCKILWKHGKSGVTNAAQYERANWDQDEHHLYQVKEFFW